MRLQSLKEVKVEKCDNLKYLFRLSVDNGLRQLHTLEIKSCSQLEDIILGLQVPYVSLQSLWEVNVEKCDNLKYLFPLSVASCLGQLHTLKIKSCSQLENIIQDPQVPYISLQSLREVKVEKCDNLKYLFPLSATNTLGQLHTLKIKSCSQLEDVIQDLQELVLGRVTYKQLSNICKYEELEQNQTSSHHPQPVCFPNLTAIVILECESLKSMFPITVAHGDPRMLNAPSLQTLKIERCFGLEEIIQDSQISIISFQCLREVQVTECNDLKYLFPMSASNNLGQLQTLKIEREVKVTGCNNLKYLFVGAVKKEEAWSSFGLCSKARYLLYKQAEFDDENRTEKLKAKNNGAYVQKMIFH
ncbi:hypothetical protein Godav_028859 [Gossypium davidsonii]|uniref:Disease resistance protein At4g27190-like leucine-rich repeats domain-containing protein n=1 Tax=Gossypium davidsonii TaxID=34287 RepID=A0A7J8TJ00_GOSDV|nr:hypothetical protein [Gossypium davidsonii]